MTPLNIHAGGHTDYLEMLTTRLQEWIKKINSDSKLSPWEKFEARQKAKESTKNTKKKALKTVTDSGYSLKNIYLKVSA